jgi:hypothetical protein
MPEKVYRHFGFRTAFASYGRSITGKSGSTGGLVFDNDNGVPFPVLADLMDKHEETLFA